MYKGHYYPLYSAKHRVSAARRVSFFEGTFVIVVFILSTGIASIFPEVYFAGSPLVTYFWLASYIGVGVILCLHHGIQWLFWSVRYGFLMGIVLLAALASVSWSVDPMLTLQRAIHLIGTTLIGYYIGFHVPTRAALLLLAWALTIIIIGNVFIAIALPHVGQEETLQGAAVWKGWHYHKNGLGVTATIACLFFSIRMLSADVKSRWAYLALSVLSFIVILKSGSATALVALFAGGGIAMGLTIASGLRLSGWITGSLLGLLLLMMGLVGVAVFFADKLDTVTSLVGRSGDLTGRTQLWEIVWSLLMERPWLGYGYGGLWGPKPDTESGIGPMLEDQLGWLPPTAHSGFLNIASELGLPIAILAVLCSLQMLAGPALLYLRRPSTFALLVVALLTALIVRTLTENVIFTDRSLGWIVFVALPILLLRSVRRIERLSLKPPPSSDNRSLIQSKTYRTVGCH